MQDISDMISLQIQYVRTSLLNREEETILDAQEWTFSLGRWQPDIVVISWSKKKIGILDVRRTNDSFKSQLDAAAEEKRIKYRPLIHALKHYTDQNWDITILPWVVVILGLIERKALLWISFKYQNICGII